MALGAGRSALTKDGHPLFIQQCACGVALGAGCWALDFDFDIFLKGKKDGHPLFIQQCGCGVALGAGCWALRFDKRRAPAFSIQQCGCDVPVWRWRWRLARSAPPLVMFQILRKFHTEEMSTVKAERPAPSATLEHHSRTAECYYELSTFFLVGKMLSPNVGAPRRM